MIGPVVVSIITPWSLELTSSQPSIPPSMFATSSSLGGIDVSCSVLRSEYSPSWPDVSGVLAFVP